MPVRSFARDFMHKLGENDVSGNAAELAYYFMFSVFPFFLFLATLLGYVPIPHLVDKTLMFFGGVLPPTAARIVSTSLHSVVSQKHEGLLSLGILMALWSASTAVSVFATTLDNAYGVKEARPYWKVRLQAIALTVALSVLVIATVGLSVFGRLIDHFVTQQLHLPLFHTIWSLARWPVAFVLAMFGLMLLYRYS
ncbi:MAG TPA: YihY/virulence factor BrkB family protein, partial [Acidiferrobacteraceae bacterium]|nr:YihY/virulence factor BrkB family protein [Acidiferrobacteraceae bacterium]